MLGSATECNFQRTAASKVMREPYDEEDLVARLRAGDKAACAECVEIHSPAIYRLALRLMESEAEARQVA